MLWLGLPERACGLDLGDDAARPKLRRVDVGDRVLGNVALRVRKIVDARSIRRADVVALAVLRRRIVNLKEEFEQVAVGQPLRVEIGRASVGKECRSGGVL